MKNGLFVFLLGIFGFQTYSADIPKNFCKAKAENAARLLLKNEGEQVKGVEIKRVASSPVSGEDYSDEIFDINLKTKKGERCVTLNYFGSAKTCTLVSYKFPGCH